MRQIVYPIKDSVVLKQVQDTLLHNFNFGRRNYTIFQVGKATLLRVSDVLKLKYSDIFTEDGQIKHDAYIHDKKTGKANILYLKPVADDLKVYRKWLIDNDIHSEWLFPTTRNDKHVAERDLRDEVKDCIDSVTLVNPSFKDDPKSSLIIKLMDNTSLCIKDILKLTYEDIFDDLGQVKTDIHIKNSKTKEYDQINLSSIKDMLVTYSQWLKDNDIHSKWLFPDEQDRHINERNFYLIMQRVGDLLGINYLGTHSMRKTGAYRVYVQSGYNISLVMSLLNHSSQAMTLKYLGLDRESTENMLDKINFG